MDLDTFITWAEFPDIGIPQFSRRYVNVLIDEGKFPPAYRLTAGRIAWRRGDLETWKITRPRAGEPVPVLWPKIAPVRGRGICVQGPQVGRKRGSKMVTVGVDADGRPVRRLLSPDEVAAREADVAAE